MYTLKNVFITTMAFISLPFSQVSASLEFDKKLSSPGTFNVSGPADADGYGSIVYNSGSSNSQRICNSSSVNYNLTKVLSVPVATWTGRTFQDTSSHPVISLFESGILGFSLSPMGGLTDSGYPTNWQPLSPDTTTIWTGNKANASRISSGLRITSGVYVYKDETRFSGSEQIPEQTVLRYLCQDSSGVTQEIYNYILSPITVIGTVTGCTPDSSTAIIDMDKIAQSTIEKADSSTLIGTKKYTASLSCDPNINVSVSIVDLSDTSNNTNIANLTSDSTAKGVGFAVTGPSGNRLRFGPDGSATGVPGQLKYFIQRAGSASPSRNNRVSTQFGFSYIRKSDEIVKSGTAKAVIGLTYSYQ